MKRQLKYRAWHGPSKNMFNWSDFAINGRNNCIIHDKEGVFTIDKVDDNSVELMQFTGGHDKNGVEIYEGDIKRWQFNDSDRYSVCYWSKIDYGFRWRLIKHNETQANYNHDIKFDTEEDFYDYVIGCNQRENGFDSWSTIVGNIYSNPELL